MNNGIGMLDERKVAKLGSIEKKAVRQMFYLAVIEREQFHESENGARKQSREIKRRLSKARRGVKDRISQTEAQLRKAGIPCPKSIQPFI